MMSVKKLIWRQYPDSVKEELSEDYARLAGLSSGEDFNEPLRTSVAKRLPWLLILLALGLFVSGVVGLFENVAAQITVVVCFQSLILDMAGNAGTQSLAVTIRILMDENLGVREKLLLIFKESRVGLVNGLLLGVSSFVLVGCYLTLFKGQLPGFSFTVSACIGLSMLLVVILSSAIGTAVPILFDRIGVDPAVASGPLITTVNDLVAVVSYYGLTWLFLIRLFHFV